MKKIMRIEDYVKENREVINDLRIASALLEKRRPIIAESLMDLAERLDDLAESEDERIRKFLVKHVSEWIGCIEHDLKLSSKDGESEEELAMFKAGLDYLKKQKEPYYTKRNALFDKCVENCNPKVMKEVSDKVDAMLEKEQKPAEWSEEDEKFAYFVNQFLEYHELSDPTAKSCKKWFNNRFKSLRPVSKEFLQPHWKPSDEQMKALWAVWIGGDTPVMMALGSLLEDLKKL